MCLSMIERNIDGVCHYQSHRIEAAPLFFAVRLNFMDRKSLSEHARTPVVPRR
jgi:hypothetical protein